jgi:hypothetical protein
MIALISHRIKLTIGITAFALSIAPSVWSQVQVLSNHYDNGGTGANPHETILNTFNVSADQFGKLGAYQINGTVYAQPLYVPNVMIAPCAGCTEGQSTHNVLYVVTMNDIVYAFDADTIGPPLLTLDVTTQVPGSTPIPIAELAGSDSNIVGNVGIESTPVIDPGMSTMYFVARTEENGNYVQRLHAVDITNFSEKFGGPVTIQASVPGTAVDAVDGQVIFNPKTQNQRAAIALSNGVVLIAWAAHNDLLPYHGWIIGYDASTLLQVPGAFCDTPDGSEGGIWQSGRGPAIDSEGNSYYETGNGDWDGARNFGESLLKFAVSESAGITLLDWFTPGNYSYLSNSDLDLSSGPMLIPNSNLVLGSGKESVFYLLNSDNLGQEVDGDTQTVQDLGVYGGNIKNGPVFWSGSPSTGPLVYIWADHDILKAYHFNGTTLDTNIYAQGSSLSPGSPGGALTITSESAITGSGIVWASLATDTDGDQGAVAGILRAYNAENLAEIWNSEVNFDNDRLGTLSKFVPPTVVNGKVYMATQDGAVAVYGLLPSVFGFSISSTPISAGLAPGGSVSFSTGVNFLGNSAGSVALSASGFPSGVSATFFPSSLSASGIATLNLVTPANTPEGAYIITITGDGGSVSHSSDVSMVVTLNAGQAAISINFVGLGTAMGNTESAGVVSKTNWNNASNNSGSMALNDETGSVSGATVSWNSDNNWGTNISDQPGNFRMMNGYLDTGNVDPTNVNVSGLPANANGYTVYVYADGDNAGQAPTGIYQISGTGITTSAVSLLDPANTNFSGSFTQANNSAGNYVVFTTNSGVSGFTLTATPGPSNGSQRAPVNGIQIIPSGAPPSPDFSINATPAALSIVPGAQISFTVSVAALNGFSGTIGLSASGLPTGASASFSTASITGSGNATLSVSSTSSTPLGAYIVSITGTSALLSRTTTISLNVTTASSGANSISINFAGLGAAMENTESAGVVARTNWNNASGNSGSGVVLVDETGTTTNATVSWSSDNVWGTNISDIPGNFRMMKGYLDTGNANPTTVSVSGLQPGTYDIYVYVDGDNAEATHTGIYQLSGPGIPAVSVSLIDLPNANFTGTFIQANNSNGNYLLFSGITTSGFTLTATPGQTSNNNPRAPVNGIQIVPRS